MSGISCGSQRSPFGEGDGAAGGGGVSGVEGGGHLDQVNLVDEGGEPVESFLVLQAAEDDRAVQVRQDLPAVVLTPPGEDLCH